MKRFIMLLLALLYCFQQYAAPPAPDIGDVAIFSQEECYIVDMIEADLPKPKMPAQHWIFSENANVESLLFVAIQSDGFGSGGIARQCGFENNTIYSIEALPKTDRAITLRRPRDGLSCNSQFFFASENEGARLATKGIRFDT